MRAKNLLLVDDDRSSLARTSKALRSAGYEVFETASEAEALRLLRFTRIRVDLAVVNLGLSERHGREFARQLIRDHGLQTMHLSALSTGMPVDARIGIDQPGQQLGATN